MKSLSVLSLALVLGLALTYFFRSAHESQIAPYRHRIFVTQNSLQPRILEAEKKLKTNPDGHLVMAELAGLYAQQAKLTGDMELFEKAEAMAKKSLTTLSFQNQSAKVVLADIAQAHHDFEGSIRISQEILADKTARRGAKIQADSILATSYLAMGNLHQASFYADALMDLSPSMSSLILHALVMTAQGREDEALFDYQTAFTTEQFGDVVNATRLRAFWGRYYLKLGNYKSAEDLIRESLRISPEDPQALGLLGELDLKTKKYEQAKKDFSHAFSASKQIIYLYGQVRAMDLANDAGGASEMRNQVEKIIRTELEQPKNYAHKTELIRLLLDRGNAADVSQALVLAEEEIKLRQSAEASYLLSRAYLANGMLSKAQASIREVLGTGVRDSEYFELASQVAARAKDAPLSAFYAKQALHFDPLLVPAKVTQPVPVSLVDAH